MCGILGKMTTGKSEVSFNNYRKCIDELFLLSESRGKEASGVCIMRDDEIRVIKAGVRASKLIKTYEYKRNIGILRDDRLSGRRISDSYRFVMGHARMVTNGSALNQANNQPIVHGDLVIVHNGIIVNDEDLWKKYSDLKRKAEVDTEIFAALLEKFDYKKDFLKAFNEVLSEIEGSLSVAIVDRRSGFLVLYTNTGSLYVGVNKSKNDYTFASERYILERVLIKCESSIAAEDKKYHIIHVKAGNGLIINLHNGICRQFLNSDRIRIDYSSEKKRRLSVSEIKNKNKMTISFFTADVDRQEVADLLRIDLNAIHSLKRCRKCLLPETFPGISFDSEGVCNVCKTYKRIEYKGRDALIKDLKMNKMNNSRFDCISPISGGRDSCFILHYLVKEMGLKPVAYTYDWGLVTDLARRNIQRMCASLGVEHILISADISKKRYNVRKNVEAWLKNPQLSTVPLFMAGDKQFFFYAQLLKRQMRVDNVIFGMNALEETQFKARFAMMKPGEGEDLYYNFSSKNKVRLAFGYWREFLENPAYINSSMLDSFWGFLSYYALPQRYLRFFDYIPWDQAIIEKTLINNYNWESAKDTEETWRIGDGTAPFYNYIYYRMAGFTEFDTFKSNQIREGLITRDEALRQIDKSNEISVDGFLWYCKTIGIDPLSTLKIINNQKPLYHK